MPAKLQRLLAKRLFTAIVLVAASLFGAAAKAETTVFAAASLTDIVMRLADLYEETQDGTLWVVIGASSTLARQVVAGAPADVYISANLEWAEHVAQHDGFAEPVPLFGNTLVLVAEGDFTVSSDLSQLPNFIENTRLALGDPTHVPAGIYAEQALRRAGIYNQLADHLVPAADVRTAIGYVLRGAATFGLVYETDVRSGLNLITAVAPELYAPIVYYAVPQLEMSEQGQAFWDFLQSPRAQSEIVDMGFKRLNEDAK